MALTLQLPTLPAAHARALALLAHEDATIAELSAVVEGDAALTAAVLKAANSAVSAPLMRIGTAAEAIVRIGLRHTRRIVAGAALSDVFSHLSRSGLDADELWRHLLATAVISDATAWAQGPRTQAFTAGLLHDVGRMAMATQDPDAYHVAVVAARRGEPVREVERDIFGVDHVQFGAHVGAGWRFPDSVVRAIGDHHDGDVGALEWVTYNARGVAWQLGIGDGVLSPDHATLSRSSPDWEIVAGMGGREGLLAQLEWYRGAILEGESA